MARIDIQREIEAKLLAAEECVRESKIESSNAETAVKFWEGQVAAFEQALQVVKETARRKKEPNPYKSKVSA